MRVAHHLIPEWPKLVWLATWRDDSDEMDLYVGRCVETSEHGCVAAVWAGDYETWGFDRTDLVFGSGVRLREEGVYLVAAGSGQEPLWHVECDGRRCVSDSLPALLAFTGLSLRDDGTDYGALIRSYSRLSLAGYERWIPTMGVDVGIFYFHNLLWDGRTLREVEKPDMTPAFEGFRDYERWLIDVSRQLGRNVRSAGRRHPIAMIASVSSGYDSPATAAIARHAGCTKAMTIGRGTSLGRRSDSGAALARQLGYECTTIELTEKAIRDEEYVFACNGGAGGLRMSVFRYPQPLCLVFHGGYGDHIWDGGEQDLSAPIGHAEYKFWEFQLHEGLLLTYVPCWGIRHAKRVHALGRSPEMAPWTLHTDYDRPIPRRIVEEAGIPRGSFARRKEVSSTNTEVLWPYTPESRASYRRFRRRHGLRDYSPPAVFVLRWVAWIENMLWRNVLRRLGIRRRWRPWREFSSRSHMFLWANGELKERYARVINDRLEERRVRRSR